jgi:maleylacetate reductase
VIVVWSLDELPSILRRLRIASPLLVASPRAAAAVSLELAGHWSEVPSAEITVPALADGLLAVGGGSAIDTAKAASDTSGVPLVSVPTTYSGAEWTPSYGVRTADRRIVGGGSGARLEAIVYEVSLTLDLPRSITVGSAMNALAHCAEALYVRGTNAHAQQRGLEGAQLIAASLPRVVDAPHAAAGEALALAGLGLAHAIAQALGGGYGLPHGAMNALALPPALRFNTPLAPEAIGRFGVAIGAPDDPATRVEELASLGGFARLEGYGVPATSLDAIAAAASGRNGNLQNPRPATTAEIEQMLRSIW